MKYFALLFIFISLSLYSEDFKGTWKLEPIFSFEISENNLHPITNNKFHSAERKFIENNIIKKIIFKDQDTNEVQVPNNPDSDYVEISGLATIFIDDMEILSFYKIADWYTDKTYKYLVKLNNEYERLLWLTTEDRKQYDIILSRLSDGKFLYQIIYIPNNAYTEIANIVQIGYFNKE